MTRQKRTQGKPQSFRTRQNPESVQSGSNPVRYSSYRESANSPRYEGIRAIQLRQNPHVFRRGRLISESFQSSRYSALNGDIDSSAGPLGGMFSSEFSSMLPSLENRAGAKFNKKLRTGSASLGISLATWRQSRDMFTTRITRLSNAVYLRTRKLERDPRKLAALRAAISRERARQREPVANLILETEFGWRPLYDDISAASKLATSPFPPTFTRAGAKGLIRKTTVTTSGETVILESIDGVGFVTYGAMVSISNPNLYLANKAGIANPLSVAWDLVPWSFVVNMFVNVNAHINSLTNELGLSITDRALTRTRAGTRQRTVSDPTHGGQYVTFGKEKTRVRVNSTPLHWQITAPSFSWETAMIAGSLLVQRINKLNRLIRF